MAFMNEPPFYDEPSKPLTDYEKELQAILTRTSVNLKAANKAYHAAVIEAEAVFKATAAEIQDAQRMAIEQLIQKYHPDESED
jgi:hypothetical protein